MSNDRVDPNSLPFSQEKQRAVLGHVIFDEIFFSATIAKLEPEWFSDPVCLRLFKAVKSWHGRWHRRPTIQEVLDSPDITCLPTAELNQYRAMAAAIKTSRSTYHPEPLLAEMEVWCKARLLQTALPKAASAYNAQKIDGAVDILNSTIKEFHDINFLSDGALTFDDFRAELLSKQNQKAHAITFGLSAMDMLLDKSNVGGSMYPGEMTVFLAATNVGKTSAMVTTAVANIMRGKSVLFVFHEGTKFELKEKFMRCLTGMSTPELELAYADEKMVPRLHAYEEILKRFLTLLPINKPGLTVEEVAGTIETFQEKRRLANGRGYDLLVDDYPAKLSTTMASKGNLQLRHVHEIVYNAFVQIGLRHNFHVLVAVQTNRDGSKVNRKIGQHKHESRLLHMEDVMESWGVMTAAAVVISLNRTDTDTELRKLTYLVCKSRHSETGWAVVANTDYERCRTHSEEAGCFWYRGSDSLGEKASAVMAAFRGQVVPQEKIRYYEQLGTL